MGSGPLAAGRRQGIWERFSGGSGELRITFTVAGLAESCPVESPR